MKLGLPRHLLILSILFWICAIVTIITWVRVPSLIVGWDLHVYATAMRYLRIGHDPYVDGIAIQRVFHAHLAEHPNAPPPFTYVYSPITLPLLRWLGHFPLRVVGSIYWTLYVACAAIAIWVGMQAVEIDERKIFVLLAPAAIFFPGLLENDVLFSGNVAYLVYGLIFVTAWIGWRKGQWMWFYPMVLAASCCKAPLLSLVAIPILSSRKQWVPTIATAACGVGLFALQPHRWPSAFHHYLTAVELQFSYNHDFSCSPAGLLADALYNVIPYTVTSLVFYLFYAIPIFAILFYLSRRYLNGDFSLRQWMPVLLVGVMLLNPRIMEYDVASLSVPMALIAWRTFAKGNTFGRTILEMALLFAFVNSCSRGYWRQTECLLLVGLFGFGAWNLYSQVRQSNYRSKAVPRKHEERMLVGAQV